MVVAAAWLCVVDADGGGGGDEEKRNSGSRGWLRKERGRSGAVASAFAMRPEYQ